MQQDYEKLGVFYMGREYDRTNRSAGKNLILYDSKDLVTHGVCVGMTGSGKTGLCISLLEEAAIDGIPALVIDPKGDLSNLLLQFPGLSAAEFEPWVNADDARKKGLSVKEFAQAEAANWKKGLADWDQDADRVQRLKNSADFAIYTPGSNAGIPVSILHSFDVPEPEILEDSELFRERVSTTTTSLLSLLDIDADPVQSREHILISTILQQTWRAGKSLSLASLIEQIQNPPMKRIGVLELETYFPAKDRFSLAMLFNNLLASPTFESWLEGVPLDVQSLLYTKEGKPRIAILSISHLSDQERMFFVSLILNQVIGWMRHQPGTTSLRAIVYMDEIFGYFPPVKNPPSKLPLLTLLKQARAFGVGVMLATQNPVDLDYKGLANCGTWFIGRLQTERDKLRVLDGLEGASSSNGAKFDRSEMAEILSSLGSRVFLLHNVHDDHPVVFQTRWALTYLRGPMTRQHIKSLMDPRRADFLGSIRTGSGKIEPSKPDAAAKSSSTGEKASEISKPSEQAPVSAASDEDLGRRPILPPEVQQFFVPVRGKKPQGDSLAYQPAIYAAGEVYLVDTKLGVDASKTVNLLATLTDDAVSVDWSEATETDLADADLERDPAEPEARYGTPIAAASKLKSYDSWKKAFADHLYRNVTIDVFRCSSLDEVSKPDESERDFRVRLQQAAREMRDQQAEQLRQRYAPKFASLEEKIRKAQQTTDKQKSKSRTSKLLSLLSMAGSVFSAFVSRRKISITNVGRVTTAARQAGRTMQDSQSVEMAEENLQKLVEDKQTLEEQFQQEVKDLESKIDPATEEFETISVKPKKTNITCRLTALAWTPYWCSADGTLTKASD